MKLIRATWNVVKKNAIQTWEFFAIRAKTFWNGGPLKMAVDIGLTAIIALIAPVIVAAFAGYNFTGASSEIMSIVFGVGTAIFLAGLTGFMFELVIILGAFTMALTTQDVLDELSKIKQQRAAA